MSHIMVDGQVYGPYELASDPIFSRDGQHVVWSATDTGSKRERMFVVGIRYSVRAAARLLLVPGRGEMCGVRRWW
jgi:hypothetical protein